MHFGGIYVPVPDWMIEQLRAREEGGALSQSALTQRTLQPETGVTVSLGGDTDTEGVVFSRSGEENVIVLMNLLNRRIRATIPQNRVEPLKNR